MDWSERLIVRVAGLGLLVALFVDLWLILKLMELG